MRHFLGEPAVPATGATLDLPKGGSTPPADNKVYFFKDVTQDSVAELCHQLEDAIRGLRTTFCAYPEVERPPVHLYINSFGGDLFAGLASYGYIRQIRYPIFAHVVGCAMSAASILMLACERRFISKHAVVLIHQLRTGFWGRHDEFKDEQENMDLLMGHLRAIYLERTEISEKEVEALLKRDLFLSSEQALHLGFVAEIEG